MADVKKDPEILSQAMNHVRWIIARLGDNLTANPWNSLPELTNEEGSVR